MGLRHPQVGLRPAVRFAIALTLTLAYLAFAVWFSEPWRSDLEEAIGPVMAWLIPTMLAFIPSIVIGFLGFTLLLTRYRPLELSPPEGHGRAVNGPQSRS